jgi:hypothetical protein
LLSRLTLIRAATPDPYRAALAEKPVLTISCPGVHQHPA